MIKTNKINEIKAGDYIAISEYIGIKYNPPIITKVIEVMDENSAIDIKTEPRHNPEYIELIQNTDNYDNPLLFNGIIDLDRAEFEQTMPKIETYNVSHEIIYGNIQADYAELKELLTVNEFMKRLAADPTLDINDFLSDLNTTIKDLDKSTLYEYEDGTQLYYALAINVYEDGKEVEKVLSTDKPHYKAVRPLKTMTTL